jgi:alpha-beta hydrolase superfamily lysophospholipase
VSFDLAIPAGQPGAGARLHAHCWPVERPRGAVLLVHGYAEHLGRYEHVAARLNAAGLAVYALDHWGHGQSDGEGGFVPAFGAFTAGVEALLARVKAELPGVPRVLIGHSMGGLIAVHHLLGHQQDYACAVLSGPAIAASEPPSAVMIFVSRLLSRLAPRLGVLALDADGVSRDPAVVAAYKADPLVYSGKMSARLAKEMFEAMGAAQAGAGQISLPLLMLHGEADRLTAPEGSRLLDRTVASTDKRLAIFPGLYHEIFNEPEQGAVLDEMVSWIIERLPVGDAA